MESKSVILSKQQIRQKIRRIAYEIYENNFKEKQIVLAGIYDNGHKLANLIRQELEQIAVFQIELISVSLDKSAPTQSEIKLDCEEDKIKNKTIILIDDVMNTGRTMAYSLKPFLNVKIKKLETAVLVNRSHTEFPVSVQYTGYELSTSIKEHIAVQLDPQEESVYLQ